MCVSYLLFDVQSAGQADSERAAHAMADPEIQAILTDPMVRQVLTDFKENPQHAQKVRHSHHINTMLILVFYQMDRSPRSFLFYHPLLNSNGRMILSFCLLTHFLVFVRSPHMNIQGSTKPRYASEDRETCSSRSSPDRLTQILYTFGGNEESAVPLVLKGVLRHNSILRDMIDWGHNLQ